MTSRDRTNAADLVPLADRLRFMRIFRVITVALVAGLGIFAPDLLNADRPTLASATGLYLAVALLAEWVWRLWGRRGLGLFAFILIVDAVYLVWLTYFTGYLVSPLRALILLHLIAVALLGSYRTGMKLTMWHSMLLLSVYYAEQGNILEPTGSIHALAGTDFEQLMAFIAVVWLVAIVTASFSAVNERELRRRRYDLEALAALAAELEGAQSPAAVAEGLVAHVADAFAFPGVVVLGHSDGVFTVLACRGAALSEAGVVPATRAEPVNRSIVLAALEQRETLLVEGLDAVADQDLAGLLPRRGNYVVVPLTAEGKSIGVLVAQHSMRPGSRVERRVVSMLERFTSQTALALRGAALLEQVQHMAATDGLTMIANRRTFEATLEKEIARAGHSRQVSLVMLDIDHFKTLNDVYGHQAGDRVLREVAKILEEQCRAFDTAARYGGEEFAAVLPSCPEEEATRLANQIRMTVAGSTSLPVTVSVGVGTFPHHAGDAESLVRAADRALYEAKHQGRNRVVSATAVAFATPLVGAAPPSTMSDGGP